MTRLLSLFICQAFDDAIVELVSVSGIFFDDTIVELVSVSGI